MDKAIAFEGETSSVGWDNITGKPDSYPPESHTHGMAQVTGLEDKLSSIQDEQGTLTTKVDTLNVRADSLQQQIKMVKSDVDDKANIEHTHEIADVTNLQSTLDGKANSSHNHSASQITAGTLSVARGGTGRSTLTSGYFLRGNGTDAVTMSSVDEVKEALGIGGGTSYVGMTYNLTGIAVGHPVMWANDIWMCVHISGTTYYLASTNIYGSTPFDSGGSTAYSGSILAVLCADFQEIIPEDSLALAVNTTVNGVTNKIFVASREQMDSGFSYFNNDGQRICDGTSYWTSSLYSSTTHSVQIVDNGGRLEYGSDPKAARGFRPFVALRL